MGWRTRKKGSGRQRGSKFLVEEDPKVSARVRAIQTNRSKPKSRAPSVPHMPFAEKSINEYVDYYVQEFEERVDYTDYKSFSELEHQLDEFLDDFVEPDFHDDVRKAIRNAYGAGAQKDE